RALEGRAAHPARHRPARPGRHRGARAPGRGRGRAGVAARPELGAEPRQRAVRARARDRRRAAAGERRRRARPPPGGPPRPGAPARVPAAVERRARGAAGPARPPERPPARLRELVEERLRLLDPGPRAALEIVAVGEQVPLAAAERLADPDDVEELERRGLVEVVGDRAVVQVAHPLYGEVIAADLPRTRRRAILRDLVEAVGDLDTVDRLRVATWRLESGAPGDAEQLLALGREALGRLDHALAERLALAAGGTARAEAGLVLAEALTGQGR